MDGWVDGDLGWGRDANLFLLLERPRELCGPCLCFLVLRFFGRKTRTPLTLDVLTHGAQWRTEIILVALNDHLELSDIARLLAEQAVFLAFWRIGGQLGTREERLFECKNLRRLRLDLTACGEELLLKLCVREPSEGG